MGQGLPVRQRRVLERTESALRGSDPKLAALYAVFSRLSRDEEMPRIEQLRYNALRAFAWLARPAPGAGSKARARWRAVLFFPIAIALAVTAIFFAARSSSMYGCTAARSAVAAKVIPKDKLCRSPAMLTPLYMGR